MSNCNLIAHEKRPKTLMMEILSKMTRAPVCFERHLELLCDDTGNCWTDLRFNVGWRERNGKCRNDRWRQYSSELQFEWNQNQTRPPSTGCSARHPVNASMSPGYHLLSAVACLACVIVIIWGETWLFVNCLQPHPRLWQDLRRLFIPASYITQPSSNVLNPCMKVVDNNRR